MYCYWFKADLIKAVPQLYTWHTCTGIRGPASVIHVHVCMYVHSCPDDVSDALRSADQVCVIRTNAGRILKAHKKLPMYKAGLLPK